LFSATDYDQENASSSREFVTRAAARRARGRAAIGLV